MPWWSVSILNGLIFRVGTGGNRRVRNSMVDARKSGSAAALIALLIGLLLPLPDAFPGPEGTGEDLAAGTKVLIDDLSSPFFLVRDRALKGLERVDERSIPLLVKGLKSEHPRVVCGCLGALTRLVPDRSLNATVREYLDSTAQEVKLEAIRYLSSHADMEDPGEEAWASTLLATGTMQEIKSYIVSTRRPAPAFQTALIARNLAGLPAAVQPDAIAALAAGPRAEAALRLADCHELIRSGLAGKEMILPLLESLRDCADLTSMAIIADGLLSASPRVRQKAGEALTNLKAHLYRLRDHDASIALSRELCRLFPKSIDYRLDLAESLLLYGSDPSAARREIENALLALKGDYAVPAQLHRGEAHLGSALVSYWLEEHDWNEPLNSVRRDLDKIPGDFSGFVQARAFLLEGALIAATGGDGSSSFLEAFAVAPYRQDDSLIDSCLSGRFSLKGFVWMLAQKNREDLCLTIYDQLVAALRSDDSGSSYYPSPEAVSLLDDRSRSSMPLVKAMFQRYEGGDPSGAIASLNEFIAVVQDSSFLNNLDLTARAYFTRGAAEADLGDLALSRDSIGKGIGICDELLGEYRDGLEKDKLLAYRDAIRSCSRMKARGLLQLATVNVLAGDGTDAGSRLIREAAALAPSLTDTLMSEGIRLARAGFNESASAIAAAVEEYPDQFYNKACLYLLVGEKEKALIYLSRHFREHVKLRRLELARKYALADPDLKTLRRDPRFLEILGVDR